MHNTRLYKAPYISDGFLEKSMKYNGTRLAQPLHTPPPFLMTDIWGISMLMLG